MCKWYTGQARPMDGKLMTEVRLGREKLKVMPSFCYLVNCSSSGGGCQLAMITRCCVTWGKFNKFLSILTTCSFHITFRERVYNLCVRNEMLHASETWAPTFSDLHQLQHNDQAMICLMGSITCNVWLHRWGFKTYLLKNIPDMCQHRLPMVTSATI